MRKLLTSLCVVAGLGAGATAVAGCGAEKAVGLDVAKAASATAGKGTARMAVSLSVSGAGLPLPIDIKGKGVTALDRPEGTLTFDLGPVLSLAGVPSGSTGTDLEMRFTPKGVVYAKLPSAKQLGIKLPGGKQWASLDLPKLAAALDLPTRGLGKLFSLEPAAQLRALKAAKSIKEVGKEDVNGEPTTHYRGTVKLSDYARTLSPAEQADVKDALAKLKALDPSSSQSFDEPVPVDLWVGEDGVTRKTTSTSKLPSQGGQPGGSIKQSYVLSDFGTPLDAAPPAAGDTFDATAEASKVLGALSAAGGSAGVPTP